MLSMSSQLQSTLCDLHPMVFTRGTTLFLILSMRQTLLNPYTRQSGVRVQGTYPGPRLDLADCANHEGFSTSCCSPYQGCTQVRPAAGGDK